MDATLPLPAGAPAVDRSTDLAALDAREAWEAFSRRVPRSEGEWETYLGIEGMVCPGCSLVVETALAALPGVRSVAVNGATATARVVWSPGEGRPSQWLAALQRAGYRGVPAGDQLDAGARRQAQRLLLWRWLVAGFCMMQVMMYATPAYIAHPGEMTPDVAALLRWASWLLTLPVLLFSCQPFFASAWRDLRQGRIGMDVPVALGILLAFGASTASTFDPASALGGAVWYDSVTMFVLFLLSGRLLEQRLRDRTAGALGALLRRMPALVERQAPDGTFERVAAGRLSAGDRIRVLAGEAIPVDGCVLAGASRVDEALLTGEADPLPRGPGDAVIAGSHNLAASLLVRVDRVGDDTRYAGIVALMERASVAKPRLARLADRLAGPFLAGVLVAAVLAGWWWWPAGAARAIGVAIAVLVVTCPCALSLATPAATLAAAGALARRGILVRRLEALEEGARIDTVVFDKTGTLTRDGMALVRVEARADVGETLALQLAAALAAQSLHPVARAIASAPGAAGLPPANGVQECAGRGLQGTVQVGLDVRVLRLGSADFCDAPLDAASTARVHLADASGWLAAFFVEEQVRDDAPDVVRGLLARGLRVQLLSGDRRAAVERLGARLGIVRSHGELSPEDKLALVQAGQAQGARVAMVGDGMNDGPVLARADLSIAMGQGAPMAQSTCDVIVPGGQLDAVPLVLATARRTRRIVRENIAWAVTYNAVCVPLAIAGQMPPWLAGLGMALSSLLVVLNAARLASLRGGWAFSVLR